MTKFMEPNLVVFWKILTLFFLLSTRAFAGQANGLEETNTRYPINEYQILVVENLAKEFDLSMTLEEIKILKERSETAETKKQIGELIQNKFLKNMEQYQNAEGGFDFFGFAKSIYDGDIVDSLLSKNRVRTDDKDFLIYILPKISPIFYKASNLPFSHFYANRKAAVIDKFPLKSEANTYQEEININLQKALTFAYYRNYVSLERNNTFLAGALLKISHRPSLKESEVLIQLAGGIPQGIATDLSLPSPPELKITHFRTPPMGKFEINNGMPAVRGPMPGALATIRYVSSSKEPEKTVSKEGYKTVEKTTNYSKNNFRIKIEFASIDDLEIQGNLWRFAPQKPYTNILNAVNLTSYYSRANSIPGIFGEIGVLPEIKYLNYLYLLLNPKFHESYNYDYVYSRSKLNRIQVNLHELELKTTNLCDLKLANVDTSISFFNQPSQWVDSQQELNEQEAIRNIRPFRFSLKDPTIDATIAEEINAAIDKEKEAIGQKLTDIIADQVTAIAETQIPIALESQTSKALVASPVYDQLSKNKMIKEFIDKNQDAMLKSIISLLGLKVLSNQRNSIKNCLGGGNQ